MDLTATKINRRDRQNRRDGRVAVRAFIWPGINWHPLRVVFFFIFLGSTVLGNPLFIPAQESEETGNEEEEEVSSLNEMRRETLRFGTDQAVLGIIEQLKKDKNPNFNERLKEILKETINPKVSKEILNFFGEIESPDAQEYAVNTLERAEEMDTSGEYDLLVASLRYIRELEYKKADKTVRELLDYREPTIQEEAVATAGRIGSQQTAETLLELLKDPAGEARLKEKLVLSLGKLEYQPAAETIRTIAGDNTRGKALRWYSCHALGMLKDEESLPVLKNIFAESDPLLKSYAAMALSFFEGEEPGRILNQALRDSNARVRAAAAEGLGRREETDAVDFLDYVVRRDPEMSVKRKALEALSKIGGEGLEVLQETASEGKDYALREYALQLLADTSPSKTAETAEEIIEKVWEKDESWMLDHMGRILYRQGDKTYSDIYRRFLDHPWYIIRIYGIRGLVKAGLTGEKERLQELSEDETQPKSLRREAKAALEEL